MSRSRKLAPVAEMAHRATEAELIKLGEANAVLDRDRHQLDDLIRYRDEYMLRFRRADPVAMPAKKALELRAFLAQLDQAIQAQQQQVSHSRAQVQRQQKSWLNARNKQQAIDSLMSRYRAEDNQRQLRREQRENDEHTHAMWQRKTRD